MTWTTETNVYGVNNRGAEVGPGRLADQSRSAIHLRVVYNVYTIVHTAYHSQDKGQGYEGSDGQVGQ